ncbi:hypothetical protein ABTQ05_22105, partial [Acinetobacter baumannii]
MAMLAFAVQAKARRNILFKHFQTHYAMAGVDVLGFIVVVIVVMAVVVEARTLGTPCTPDHP